MHIVEGMLNPVVYIAFIAIALACIAVGFRWTIKYFSYSKVLLMVTSALVVITLQMLDFPVGGEASGSFIGGAFLGIVLGPWPGYISFCVVTFIQSQLFVDGGVSTMAANMVCSGLVGCFVGSFSFRLSQRIGKGVPVKILGAAAGGFLAAMCSAIAVSLVVGASGSAPMLPLLAGMLSLSLPVGAVEAVVTAALVAFVLVARPEIFEKEVTLTRAQVNKPVALVFFLLSAAAALLSFLAVPLPEMLSHIYASIGTVPLPAGPLMPAPAEGYAIPFIQNPALTRMVAGFFAIAMVGLWMWTMTSGMTKPKKPRGPKREKGKPGDKTVHSEGSN